METHNFNAIIHLARRCLHKQIEKLFQQLSLYTSLSVSLSLSHSLYAFRFVEQTENEREREREIESKHEAPFKLVHKPFPHYWSAQGGHRQKEEQTNRGTSTQTDRQTEMEWEGKRKRQTDWQRGTSRWNLHMYSQVGAETFTCSVTTKNLEKK